ncbi:hypothetical protein [uncultured Eubacterium sp.]|uniref:hypothetical protein n=1 Tax=uncultured Eubacterium sp. TaxID=165185 RepID=UPI0015A8CC65|nr:hypothetical protein [uncultured Eubacterium sp.]
MSDNPLSIDEIIRRAELIKAEAEEQLAKAQKSLDEKTQSAIKEVAVDSKAVMEKVEQLSAEEDIKSYEPPKKASAEKTQAVRLSFNKKDKTKMMPAIKNAVKITDEDENDDDMKIVGDEDTFEKGLFPNEKTKPVVLSSNDSDIGTELQEVPTLIARENLGKYLEGDSDDTPKQSEFQEDIGIQMSFDGFDDEVEEVPTIDEEIAEKILIEQRKEKVDKFRLFGPDKTDSELGDEEYTESDYRYEGQQAGILASLLTKKSRATAQVIITLFFGIIMFILTVLSQKNELPRFLSSSSAYISTGLVFLIMTAVVNYNIFLHGFNFKKGFNCDLPIAVTTTAIIAQSIGFLVSDDLWLDNGQFLGSFAALSLLISQMGKRQIIIRIIDNFDFIINQKDKYCLENIANAVDCEIIGRGILEEEQPIIKTQVKTDFPTNFMEISCKTEPSDKLSRILSPISWCLSVILAVVIGIIESKYTGINIGIIALCITTPVALLYQMNIILSDISAQLDKYNARICGFNGVDMASNADALVMEAGDLFAKQGCDLHGIKVFHKAKVDDAIVYAAAVIIKTNGPLSHVFDNVIIGKQSILPKVENVIYEEKMGVSAWVYKRKVLVGNRNMLINHGVDVPKESFENRYTRKNRKALYLAVNGKIMAMFVVSYSASPELKRELKKIEKSGITLIVRSNDPYVNEESLSELFSLPKGFIRVMDYPAARVYDKYSDMSVEKSPAYVVHDGSAKGLIASIRCAISAVRSRSTINFLTSFGVALGFVCVAFMAAVKGYGQLTAMSLIGYSVIWNLFVYMVSKLQRISL